MPERVLLIMSLLTLGFLSISCQGQRVTSPTEASGALLNLNDRSNSDAYVIFEAQPSNQYIQFFNGSDGIHFDFTVRSVIREGTPDIVQMGEIVAEVPAIEGETIENRFITVNQLARLRELLSSNGLSSSSAYEMAYLPGSNEMIGFFETVGGSYNVELSGTYDFVSAVFSNAFGLSDFEIVMFEN